MRCSSALPLAQQGNDVGTQYRSVLYWYDDTQRRATEASREMYQTRLVTVGHGLVLVAHSLGCALAVRWAAQATPDRTLVAAGARRRSARCRVAARPE